MPLAHTVVCRFVLMASLQDYDIVSLFLCYSCSPEPACVNSYFYFPELLFHIVQPVHHVHHSNQLFFHGYVGPSTVDQATGVSPRGFINSILGLKAQFLNSDCCMF